MSEPPVFKRGQAVVIVDYRGQLARDTAIAIKSVGMRTVTLNNGSLWLKDGSPYAVSARGLLAQKIRHPTEADAAELKRRRMATEVQFAVQCVRWADMPLDVLKQAQALVDAAKKALAAGAVEPAS